MGSDPNYLIGRIRDGTAPVILDVRSEAEFKTGHVPGAIHIPFWRVSSHLDRLPARHDEEIVIYCGHGPRAHIAGAALRRRGFSRVTYLNGHMQKWKALKLPLEVE